MKIKRIAIISISLIVVLIVSFLIGTGFRKRTDVVLFDYSVAKDGTAISLGVQVPTSMGYIRGFRDNGGGIKPHYLTFYSTFGGLNSSFGSVSTFVLELAPDDTEIYFNRPNGGYELVLVKEEETGQWMRSNTQWDSGENILFLTDEFWESVTEFIFYDFDESIYKASDEDKLYEIQQILAKMNYKEINNPWIEGWYLFEIQTDETVYSLGITSDIISFDGKFYKVTDSVEEEISSLLRDDASEIIIYNGKEYKKSELCDATLHWLGLSEQERMFSSYLPPEFMIFDETWGITLAVENLTTTSATIICTQSGGEATGELHTGGWYILESWTQKDGWREMPYIVQGDIAWTEEAWMIPMESTVEWEINWEYLYGAIPKGKYRIGKEIMDFRGTGDYDTAIYFAEFEILE